MADPMENSYYLSIPYDVDTGAHLLDGQKTGHELTAAFSYLNDWQHLFRRQKGFNLLEAQAEKGIVDAMSWLSYHYGNAAIDWGWADWFSWKLNLQWLFFRHSENYDKALYWARRANDHGDVASLARFFTLENLIAIRSPTS